MAFFDAQVRIWRSAADAACGLRGEQEGKTASYSINSISVVRMRTLCAHLFKGIRLESGAEYPAVRGDERPVCHWERS